VTRNREREGKRERKNVERDHSRWQYMCACGRERVCVRRVCVIRVRGGKREGAEQKKSLSSFSLFSDFSSSVVKQISINQRREWSGKIDKNTHREREKGLILFKKRV
jgi:hypothetical protein